MSAAIHGGAKGRRNLRDSWRSEPTAIIDKTFLLEQAQQAFEYLEQGQHFGKVTITLT